jgi:hypothetical protein
VPTVVDPKTIPRRGSELDTVTKVLSPAKASPFDSRPRNLPIGPGYVSKLPSSFSPRPGVADSSAFTSSNEKFCVLSPTTLLDTDANYLWSDVAERDLDVENQDGYSVEPSGNDPEAMDESVTCPVCDMSLADMLQSPLVCIYHSTYCVVVKVSNVGRLRPCQRVLGQIICVRGCSELADAFLFPYLPYILTLGKFNKVKLTC